MAKTRNLSIHRNTIERRHRKQMQAEMVRASKAIGDGDVIAYATVAIMSDGNARASWDSGAAVPLWSFADVIAGVLRQDIDHSGLEDDWRPSLQERKKPIT